MKGAYVVSDPPEGKPEAIVIATGTEVKAAQEAVKALEAEGRKIRLVSIVTKRVSVEAGATFGWDRYVGRCGLKIGIDRFGASAPMKELAEQFGFTPERIAGAIRDYLG